MKKLLLAASLLMVGVVAELPAPYPASGWRPEGPAFELPQVEPLKQKYLPPVDPRRPQIPNPYDDNVDVSVQGLPPPVEEKPIFQLSPINGQLITGSSINSDVGKLNPSLHQQQYQQQLEKAIQFARQRQFDARKRPENGLPNPQSPRQFASPSTTTTTIKPEFKISDTTTESLNQGETIEDEQDNKNNKEKVSIEVTKQDLQEYPMEYFLGPLAQLNLQQKYVPLTQLAQIRAPLYYQPQRVEQSQGFGGAAHLSALPSVLAQRELLSQKLLAPNQGFAQSPIIVQEQSLVQEPLNSYAPINQYQLLNQYQPQQQEVQILPQFKLPTQQIILQPQGNQIQPTQFQSQPNQFQPQQPNQFQSREPNQFTYQQPNQFQPQQPDQFQYQQPNQFFSPQPDQFAKQQPKDVEEVEQNDQQVVLQSYQPQFYQPNLVAQPDFNYPNQDFNKQYQPQFVQQFDPSQYETQVQGQGLQSGLDLNQQGNGIEQNEERELVDREQVEEGSRATAVATAFGTRTQPRVTASYGAPLPKVQATQGYPTTTESISQEEPTTDDGAAVAQATAIAGGRKSAKIRNRRVRPIFTLDRSGHLVLAQQ